MATIRTATVEDTASLHDVCLRTGAAGEDATALHEDPHMLGLFWADPFVHAPEAVALVVEDAEGVGGYAVGVPDTGAFERWRDEVWLPPLRRRYPRGSGRTPADAAAVRLLHEPPPTDPAVLRRYPAHLHADLLPRVQGHGWGRRLVEDVLARLVSAGATGAHVGVDPRNARGRAFWQRLGFTPDAGLGEHLLVRGLRPPVTR
ncbi:GNAT family N-acetyltransferase [Phycicoccus sp. CSK15P-2]|uniref:GNAT family N-acetyltransferase n=1 Tax=Phycicoccus sp. CSK15P-2 TaxID=2807627 RepID=UPI001950E0B7|nr:GNAT family N-acetyltransferase [Phycicoccus sp. CSK15P-2]MBM6405902.1 GNAT family N-acetyltransferase [Phycicoccus sp. CSK15P-2]